MLSIENHVFEIVLEKDGFFVSGQHNCLSFTSNCPDHHNFPRIFSAGTNPNIRESVERLRLSPITK